MLECGCSIIAVNMPSIWSLISGGKALDVVVKLARSLTSLTSSRSDSHASNQDLANRQGSYDPEAMTMKREHGFEDSYGTEGLPAMSEPGAQKSEIVRNDSVEVHSMAKSSGEVSPVEERGFVVRCQGGL